MTLAIPAHDDSTSTADPPIRPATSLSSYRDTISSLVLRFLTWTNPPCVNPHNCFHDCLCSRSSVPSTAPIASNCSASFLNGGGSTSLKKLARSSSLAHAPYHIPRT